MEENSKETHNGFDSDIFRDRSRARMFMVVCIASISLTLASAYLGRDSAPYMLSLLALALVFLLSVPMQRKMPKVTEYFIPIATTAWILFMCIAFGNGLGNRNFLLVALVALAIYAKNNTNRILSIAVIILVALFIYLYQGSHNPFLPLPQMSQAIHSINIITMMVIISLICWNIIRDAAQANAIIAKQKQELEESNKFKDKVLSIVGHDMRAPFSSAKGLLYLLDQDMLSKEEKRQVIDQLHADIDLSLLTLDNILGWASQSYYGAVLKTRAKMEKLDLWAMAENTIQAFVNLAAQKGVSLSNAIPPGTCSWADRRQIAFVMRNLASNALKFSQRGQLITFSATWTYQQVTLSITDQGVGMAEQLRSSLFIISNRSSQRGTANEKGSGLGLIFCKEFIENNGGQLWLESEPGKGTKVSFCLTAAEPTS